MIWYAVMYGKKFHQTLSTLAPAQCFVQGSDRQAWCRCNDVCCSMQLLMNSCCPFRLQLLLQQQLVVSSPTPANKNSSSRSSDGLRQLKESWKQHNWQQKELPAASWAAQQDHLCNITTTVLTHNRG
eukprot:GHRQ01015586.1.p1 GENE.GHRQ01015586.1~~GHRQ01015586.1.p1  ORF type:complete len:127 (+),score=33.60 GHRQ01015586.1:455-835(+)